MGLGRMWGPLLPTPMSSSPPRHGSPGSATCLSYVTVTTLCVCFESDDSLMTACLHHPLPWG